MMGRAEMGRLILAGAMLGGASGCATPRMAPPADVVEATESLTTTGHKRASGALVNESFQLGEYEVTNVDRMRRRAGRSASASQLAPHVGDPHFRHHQGEHAGVGQSFHVGSVSAA